MSISAIITRGFGAWGAIKFVITRGYAPGSPAPATTGDTHDYVRHPISAQDVKRYRAKLKRDAELREEAYREKLDEANSVRSEIDRILHPPAEDFAEKPAKVAAKPAEPLPDLARLTAKQRRHIADLKRQLGVLMAEAHILEEQDRAAAREARRQKDEMDMSVITAMMNAHIHEALNGGRGRNERIGA